MSNKGWPIPRLSREDLRTVDEFLDGVRKRLDQLAQEATLPTQDELDVFLLGGTVPPRPIPQPDPDCPDCWGYGKVCPCHAVIAAHCSDWQTAHLSPWNTARCACVKARTPRG